jgi:protein-S-isoprenylcysteine O-methyltransferase Ste14
MKSIAFVLARAITYASLFIGFVLVYVPQRILSRSSPLEEGPQLPRVAGMMLAGAGAALVLWCILTFVFVGRGTPLPVDAPRRLVVRGPYAWVRNPMYLGAFLLLAGAALRFSSFPLLLYAAGFLLAVHAFVVLSEEPILRARFGDEYDAYRREVRRWLPRMARRSRAF